MTVSELFKKFRCCKPAPILPTTQIQTTSYTYQLAFVQWALEYVLSITEGYEERTSELETRATSTERAITQLQEGIDPILVDIEDLDDRMTAIEGLGNSLADSVNHLDTRVEALEQSGVSSKPEILEASGIQSGVPGGGSGYITLAEGVSTTDKITVSNGRIKIGAGVSKVKLSGELILGLYDGGNTSAFCSISKLNGGTVAAGGAYIPMTTSGVGYVPISEKIVAVSEGDEYRFGISGLSSFTGGSFTGRVLVEVIE